jgi:ATP-binding cassette subfamily C protein
MIARGTLRRGRRVDQQDDRTWKGPGFLASAGAFTRDFLDYAGRRSLLAVLLVGAGAVVEGLGLVLLIPLLALVFSTERTGGRLHAAVLALFRSVGIESAFGRLTLLVGIFAVLMVLRSLVTTKRDILLAELQIGFIEARRGEIARLLAAARWEQLVRLRHARITHLMSGDIQRVGTGIFFLLRGVVSVVMLVVQCLLAFLLSPALAAVSLAFLVVTGFAILPMLQRARRLGNLVTQTNLNLLSATAQYLGGLKMAIGQNLQHAFAREFGETLSLLSRAQIENMRQNSLSSTGLALLSALVGAAIVLAGYGAFHVPGPTLIALLLIIARMGGPVGQIQQGFQNFAYALPAYEKVRELEQELAVMPHEEPAGGAVPPEGTIAFEHVSFHYASANEGPAAGVDDLDLRIAPGEFLGIGGPSGAGKTTFADLLVGLLAPQSGRISVGGVSLDRAVLAAWGKSISYVSQDPFLFHDTVRRNLSWANPAADEAAMWRALGLADAEALVRRMEQGLDTVVGERGTLISGGERQRIALARAVLRAPRLLVLDEATNAIDVATEQEILKRLAALEPRPTIVMIAHRPESLRLCERVLWLKAGRLSDAGERAPIPEHHAARL